MQTTTFHTGLALCGIYAATDHRGAFFAAILLLVLYYGGGNAPQLTAVQARVHEALERPYAAPLRPPVEARMDS